ncbi:MAG: hypothetical protein Q4B42_05625 [Oscillospiraceae bacterium]|nr:hypothetical protein [Oscillospiraceae bacterium]
MIYLEPMKNALSKAVNKNITPRAFAAAVVILCALRLFLTAWQKLYLCPEISMLDDELMYKFAQSIAAGEWLGEYGYLTLGKRALYAVWLALLNKLGVSVLFAGQLLAVGAALAASAALRPLIKNRLHRLVFFAVLLFSPNAYADFTLRVYRDSISSSVTLIFFACAAALVLRAGGERNRPIFLWGALAGLSFAASWLLREDAAWLLPFAALALVVSFIRVLKIRTKDAALKLSALAASVLVALAGIGAYCYMNYSRYGRFITSDLTSSEFTAAYGAMTRVVVPEEDRNPIVPVPASSRERLAEISPCFAELMPYLEADDFLRWQKDCGGGLIEYSGGGIYWALRNAASLAGYYESPETARAFFEKMADEINSAADAGLLGEVLPKRSGLNSPITSYYVAPTLETSVESLIRVVSYGSLRCDPENSVGSDLLLDEMEDFLNCACQRVSYGETSSPNANKLVFWAVSETAPVSALLLTESGEPIRCQTIASTAGDIYLDYLQGGEDLRYTAGARLTLYYESEEAPVLSLSAGDSALEIELSKTGEMSSPASEGGLTYMIEYCGEAGEPYNEYGFLELWLYRLMRLICWLYRPLGILLFTAGAAAFARFVIALIKKRIPRPQAGAFALVCGFLTMAALRIGMMSFADVSAFGLGVYTMYLAAVYPLITLWEFGSIALWVHSQERV